MFLHHCTVCDHRSLAGASSVVGIDNTDAGPIALVRCPNGHVTRVDFREPARAPAAA